MSDQILAQYISSASSANARAAYSDAIHWCDLALRVEPKLPEAWYNRGIALAGLNKSSAAIAAFTKAKKYAGSSADALNAIGMQLIQVGAPKQAEHCLRDALKLSPNHALALINYAQLRQEQGRLDDAEDFLLRALHHQPNHATAHSNLAALRNSKRDYTGAKSACLTAIDLQPTLAEAWSNLSAALIGLGQFNDAEAASRKALELNSSTVDALINLGTALCGSRRYAEAETAFQRAVSIEPDTADSWAGLACALYKRGLLTAAERAARRAIELDGSTADAWAMLAGALAEQKKHAEAVKCFSRLLKLDPGRDYANGDLLHCRQQICDWDDFDNVVADLLDGIKMGKRAAQPFTVLGITDDPFLQQKAAEIYASHQYPADESLGAIQLRPPHDRVRIAYFSADLRNHPVAYLMAEVFERHDRNGFEISAFALDKDPNDDMRQRLRLAFDQFYEVSDKSDLEIAMMSRKRGIDIAVDLGGFTKSARPGIFALRAAPIQVSYIGYLGTMGAPYIDYLLADSVIVPKPLRAAYTEHVAYLPSYQANDTRRYATAGEVARSSFDLPDDAFVFCCFNNNYKYTREAFRSWMRILTEVERSVLFLYAENDLVIKNLRREAANFRVDSDRLVFGGRLPRSDYLARFRAADLFLDTFPYNAGTTASDALWMGLPVLTRTGRSFASRVAASVLDAVGLSELVTNCREGYEAKAIELALCPARVEEIKMTLKDGVGASRLFDGEAFTRSIESSYREMIKRWHAGLAPEDLSDTWPAGPVRRVD